MKTKAKRIAETLFLIAHIRLRTGAKKPEDKRLHKILGLLADTLEGRKI